MSKFRFENDEIEAVAQTTEFDNYDEPVYPDRYDVNFTYSAGLVQTMWFTNGINTWTKTFTYSGTNVSKISRWIRT